jgi:hypothetical protein
MRLVNCNYKCKVSIPALLPHLCPYFVHGIIFWVFGELSQNERIWNEGSCLSLKYYIKSSSFFFQKILVYFFTYFILFIYFYCCAWWGYIVAFVKGLTIYHTWIHLLHCSPLSPCLHSWNSFSRSHFSIYTHVHTVFAPYSHNRPFPTSSSIPLVPTPLGSNVPDSTLLFSNFLTEKKNDIFVCLR